METLSGRMAKPDKQSDYISWESEGITVFMEKKLLTDDVTEISFSMMNKGPFTLRFSRE